MSFAGTGTDVSFPSNGREAHGYLVLPQSGAGPGVLVIQEWWGLTDQIRRMTERYATEGFVALAPDLYGGRIANHEEEAMELIETLPRDRAARDLLGAVDLLLEHDAVTSDSVGAVGFCMGGGFVLVLASLLGDRIGAAIPIYGVPPGESGRSGRASTVSQFGDLSGITAPVQGHFAELDDHPPPDQAEELERILRDQVGVETEFHLYEGAGHAFMNDDNIIGTYDPKHAEGAFRRTVDFLRRKLSHDGKDPSA